MKYDQSTELLIVVFIYLVKCTAHLQFTSRGGGGGERGHVTGWSTHTHARMKNAPLSCFLVLHLALIIGAVRKVPLVPNATVRNKGTVGVRQIVAKLR